MPERTGGRRRNLDDYVTLAGWPTTTRSNAQGAGSAGREGSADLQTAVQLAGWLTTASGDWKDMGSLRSRNDKPGVHGQRLDQLPRQVRLVDSGLTSSGSPAGTASTGQLNPDFSRWLMGLPPEWDDCAPTATRSSRRSPPRGSKLW
jgi:hypothetical protein